MNTKVDMTFFVDIDDVYSSMNYRDQQEFIKSHIDDIGGFEDIIEQCFEERDTVELVNSYIDKATDEALIGEINNRGLEV